MTISIENFIEKYQLDNFKRVFELKGEEKVEFYNDFIKILRSICNIFVKISNLMSLRGGQVLLGLAKLENSENIINKSDIQKCLNLDRFEKLVPAFEYLEDQKYIKVRKKNPKFHVVELNEKDYPDLKVYKEIIHKFWVSPQEQKKEFQQWREKNSHE
ncbi:MAG: hypothetical protein ACW98X_18675 [Promethearchaeota archaeon]|jgi:hypothetical protein